MEFVKTFYDAKSRETEMLIGDLIGAEWGAAIETNVLARPLVNFRLGLGKRPAAHMAQVQNTPEGLRRIN